MPASSGNNQIVGYSGEPQYADTGRKEAEDYLVRLASEG